jgi:hypothetical protein
LLNYKLVDENPAIGANYYRLKQTDYDGKFEYSGIRVVNFKRDLTASNQFAVYPNPSSSDGVFLSTGEEIGGAIQIILTDMLGKIVRMEQITVTPQSVQYLDFLGIERGMYNLSIQYADQLFTQKIIFMNR